jgi:hypothetical protein
MSGVYTLTASGVTKTLAAWGVTERGPGDFSLAFRFAQARVVAGTIAKPLVPEHVYKATIRFGRRVLGSSGPYLPAAISEVIFWATQPVETTLWVDVPLVRGFETRAQGCSVDMFS